jgi:hypothetical protein
MTVHRFIAAGPKHGNKTACGIKLHPDVTANEDGSIITGYTADGTHLMDMVGKGQPFDCKRCTAVIETFRKGRMTV